MVPSSPGTPIPAGPGSPVNPVIWDALTALMLVSTGWESIVLGLGVQTRSFHKEKHVMTKCPLSLQRQ